MNTTANGARSGLCIGLLLAAGLFHWQAHADDTVRRADFAKEHASPETRHVADWVVDSGDNKGLPFALVDKKEAKVFVFHPDGRLRGADAALLGEARGDDSVPGIGDRPLSTIRAWEKTTPAGRFVAQIGNNMRNEDVLWVDYEGAVSMHRVIDSNPKEQRLKRLASPTAADNRISFGCINLPKKFYEGVIQPAFKGTHGIVYVLPETRHADKVFASYDVEMRAKQLAAAKVDSAEASAGN